MSNLLSRATALGFLQKVGVNNGEELLQGDRLVFINTLLKGFMEHVPFQSVSLLATEEKDRHVPTLEEVVEAVLSLEGGLCYILNTFMCILLRALGLNAHVLEGCHSSSPGEHNHVVCLLNDVRFEGDAHIIDVGGGYPFFEAIAVADVPLELKQAGLHFLYDRKDNDFYRLHQGIDDIGGQERLLKKNWRHVFDFRLNPVEYSYFKTVMRRIYVDEESVFLNNLQMSRYPLAEAVKTEEPLAKSEDGRILVGLKNQSLLLGPIDAAQKTRLSAEDWASKIKQYFPMIPSYKVDAAVQRLLQKLASTVP